MPGKVVSSPRVAAIVGPYLSGKTSLMESLLHTSGAIPKKGAIKDGNTVGDPSPEARGRQMSVETSIATCTYLGESWTFLDCPGSVEFIQDTLNTLMVVDVAVVVCEPDPYRALTISPILKFLDDHSIPHIIFINKVDTHLVKVAEVMEALQSVSGRPLVLREIPIREDDQITGFVDLVSERAYKYVPGKDSDLIKLPENLLPEEHLRRQYLLEALADHDDHLMEELLEEAVPPLDEIYADLRKDLQSDLMVPVFFGSAEQDLGIKRLLKALRHEAPESTSTADRLNIPKKTPLAQVFKTVHAQHIGKLSFVRVWRGDLSDGMALNGMTVSGMFKAQGGSNTKIAKALEGEIVALGKLEKANTGIGLAPTGAVELAWPKPLQPLTCISIKTVKAGDEVKLSGALHKLSEEDASLTLEHNPETKEQLLWGQGDIHLKVAISKLKGRFNVDVASEIPMVPYKETIKKAVKQHGRFKHQSGGHGAFGDVHIDIKPLPRGTGFEFTETIVGGSVPRQYHSSVEKGSLEFMKRGPLGFNMVDFAVNLYDGSFHTVDSSDAAFQQAARVALAEGVPKCEPVLLEPILELHIAVPNEFTAKAQRLVTTRRAGQILGFDGRDGWNGWDVVSAYIPQAEMNDVIVELRSLTMGVGTFSWSFHHLQELQGKEAERVVETRKKELER
ncbi:MAG: elongation factor G [Holophagaceae bacterium]|nr:elongation factor G [Holophagaceae bacterium]